MVSCGATASLVLQHWHEPIHVVLWLGAVRIDVKGNELRTEKGMKNEIAQDAA
jgi:hypothetical protein